MIRDLIHLSQLYIFRTFLWNTISTNMTQSREWKSLASIRTIAIAISRMKEQNAFVLYNALLLCIYFIKRIPCALSYSLAMVAWIHPLKNPALVKRAGPTVEDRSVSPSRRPVSLLLQAALLLAATPVTHHSVPSARRHRQPMKEPSSSGQRYANWAPDFCLPKEKCKILPKKNFY